VVISCPKNFKSSSSSSKRKSTEAEEEEGGDEEDGEPQGSGVNWRLLTNAFFNSECWFEVRLSSLSLYHFSSAVALTP